MSLRSGAIGITAWLCGVVPALAGGGDNGWLGADAAGLGLGAAAGAAVLGLCFVLFRLERLGSRGPGENGFAGPGRAAMREDEAREPRRLVVTRKLEVAPIKPRAVFGKR